MISKMLYGKSKTGKYLQWRISTEEGTILTQHGSVGGKLQITSREAEPKNVGRSNATTASEQAVLEALAKYKKKMESGYMESLDSLEETVTKLLPMLAYPIGKKQHTLAEYKTRIALQPKLDGVRMESYWITPVLQTTSRTGKPLDIPHLRKELETHLPYQHFADGEIYIEQLAVDCAEYNDSLAIDTPTAGRLNAFQILMKLVKKPQTLFIPELGYSVSTTDLEYHVYDYVNLENKTEGFASRVQLREGLTKDTPNSKIKLVQTVFGTFSWETVDSFHAEVTVKGYEGTILRFSESPYQFGHRSAYLLKYKDFMDAEFTIVGAREGKGTRKGCVIWECITPAGKPFTCGMMGTVEFQRACFDNKEQYFGASLKVKFQEYTAKNVPRFPTGLSIREDWDS